MRQTPLNDFHRQSGARLVDFAGWEMPISYTSILEEHHYTRQHATFFDVSHMGRIDFTGRDALAFLERLCTRRLGDMQVGVSRYSHVCREDGGILDDVIVSRLETQFFMVCNASNREKLLGWFDQHKSEFDVGITDRTLETAMVAIQGPEALGTLDGLLPFQVSDLKRYRFKTGTAMGFNYYVARSGYTGEDGVEIILPAKFAASAADLLVSRSSEMGRPIKPAGLGARDTLRLEAGMPLYGHELTEEWDSITAGQAWCVDLTKDFIGQPTMQRLVQAGLPRKMVGLTLTGRRIARQGAEIYAGGQRVGVVTSGTLSPTLDRSIAMALVNAAHAEPGSQLEADLRGSRCQAVVTPLPFYKRQ